MDMKKLLIGHCIVCVLIILGLLFGGSLIAFFFSLFP